MQASILSRSRGGVLYYIPFTKLISFNKQFLDFAQNPMQNLDFAQNPMQNLDSAQNPTHAMRACADDSECLGRREEEEREVRGRVRGKCPEGARV